MFECFTLDSLEQGCDMSCRYLTWVKEDPSLKPVRGQRSQQCLQGKDLTWTPSACLNKTVKNTPPLLLKTCFGFLFYSLFKTNDHLFTNEPSELLGQNH